MSDPSADPKSPKRPLTDAAKRALAEAAERRAARDKAAAASNEVPRRDGPDPTRFGDWENKGLASDF